MNLTTKQIAYLSPSFTDKSSISLFSNITATLDGTEYEKLSKKGIFQGNGYEAQSLDMLMQIAKPQRCSRLIAKNEFFIIEKYSYWSDNKLILAENSNGEFVINQKTDFSDTIMNLSEFFSISNIKTSDVFISLLADEMIVLFAIMDIYRKNTLLNYAGKTNQAEVVLLQEITNELSNGFEGGLVKILTMNYAYKMPSVNAVEQILSSLIAKKCLIFEQGYKLTENFALLAKHLLVIDTLILIENFQEMENGDVVSNGGFFATSGLHNIILITMDMENGTILLSSMSAFQMLSTIESVLKCPVIAEKAPKTVPPPIPVVVRNDWVCSCGEANTGKFCSGCGTARP